MKKRILTCLLLIVVLISFTSCGSQSDNSTFSIHFIDVGQGDSALVECDGRYMLIDGGTTTAGDKVYNILVEKGIQELDILVASHLHTDHIGGLTKALKYTSKIGVTLSNAEYANTDVFREFERQLTINGSSIKVPAKGDTYELGSATVKILEVSAEKENDSLVLLITYENTRFLFSGDIERNGQLRVISKRKVLERKAQKYSNFLILEYFATIHMLFLAIVFDRLEYFTPRCQDC